MGTDEIKYFNYCIPKTIQFDVTPKGACPPPSAPGLEAPPCDPDEFERHPPIVWSSSEVCKSPFLSNKTVDCFVESADPSLRVIVTREMRPYASPSLFPMCHHQKFEGVGRDAISDAYQYQLGTLEKTTNGWEFKLRDIPWEVAAAHFLFDPREANIFSNIYTWRSRYGEVSDGAPFEMVEENDWLDGAEIQPFIETVARDILPSIQDVRQEKKIWAAIEKALIQAASPDHNYIGILDVETSDFLRGRIRISSVPSPEEIQSKIDALKGEDRGTPPPYGFEEASRRLRDGFSSLEEYAKYADRLDKLGTPIKLMALGSAGRGGYLAETGEVVFSLPTRTQWGRVELDLAAMANSGAPAGKELVRDWNVVVRHWRKTGKLNLRSPNLGKLQKAGDLHFGNRDIPVYTAGTLEQFGFENRVVEYRIPADIPQGQLPGHELEFRWVRDIDPFERAWETRIRKLKPGEQSDDIRELQKEIDHVAGTMGERYLTELARRGVRDIVFVSNETLKKIFDAGASALARRGAALISRDSHNGILLLKQAAGKLTVQPDGLYDPDKKRIYLSSTAPLLHEMAHADEAVRKRAGILDGETLALANKVQNGLIQNGDPTVSNHPEVLAHSPAGAEERRADGLVVYWTDPDRLKRVDPDLFNYFSTITHTYEREKKGDGQRLVKNQNPFSNSYGDLTQWALENDLNDLLFISCLLFAGEVNDWLMPDVSGWSPWQCPLKTRSAEESYRPGGGVIPDLTQ